MNPGRNPHDETTDGRGGPVSEAAILRRAEAAAVRPEPAAVAAAARYLNLLLRWNARLNLTALSGDEAIDRLVIEPLAAAAHLPHRGTLLDVGSGGGSPAIPLKLSRPGIALRMVESRARKAAFLREAVRALGISDAQVETKRLEDLPPCPAELPLVVSVRAVRIDRALAQAIVRHARPAAELWLFSGSGVATERTLAEEVGALRTAARWESVGEHLLVPTLGSRLVRLALRS